VFFEAAFPKVADWRWNPACEAPLILPISGRPHDLNPSSQKLPKTLWDQEKICREGPAFTKRFFPLDSEENYFKPGFSRAKAGNFSAPAKRAKNHQL
jgi:hypothetical protein